MKRWTPLIFVTFLALAFITNPILAVQPSPAPGLSPAAAGVTDWKSMCSMPNPGIIWTGICELWNILGTETTARETLEETLTQAITDETTARKAADDTLQNEINDIPEGLACWDLDGDRACDVSENKDGDSNCDALDCQCPITQEQFDALEARVGILEGIACPAGSSLCGGTACLDLQSDPHHCGLCETNCDDLPNAYAGTCTDGICLVSGCEMYWGNCDGIGENGCEADLQHDVNNCGYCGTGCTGGTVCTMVGSVPRCCCDSSCGDLQSDPHHCGSCETNCDNLPGVIDSECSGGICHIYCDIYRENCDGIVENGCEVDVKTDENNCGSCGTVCTGGKVCTMVGSVPTCL